MPEPADKTRLAALARVRQSRLHQNEGMEHSSRSHTFGPASILRAGALCAVLATVMASPAAAANEDPFSGRYRTTDFRDTGFMQIERVAPGRWSLAISDRGEMPVVLSGGAGQIGIIEAGPELLRQRFGDEATAQALRCLAYVPPLNRLLLCVGSAEVTWTLRSAQGAVLQTHTTRTGLVSWFTSEDGDPARDLRRVAP